MTLKEEIEKLNYEIEQCRLWHEKLPKEECETCRQINCEFSKKEAEETD